LTPDYLLYHDLSYRLHQYLKSVIPDVEQFSIDEFFGDVSGWIEDEDVYEFAKEVQSEILKQFNLPISIGISHAKWIAKLATESAKPLGIYIVPKEQVEEYIHDIRVGEFPGIGRQLEKRLHSYGIYTLGQIKESKPLLYSWKHLGRTLYQRVLGLDNEGILPQKDRKSIGISRTWDPIHDRDEMRRRIVILSRHIAYLVLKQKVNPTAYFLSYKLDYGVRFKASRRVERLFSEKLIKDVMLELFNEIDDHIGHITKLSMSVSHFSYQENRVLSLIDHEEDSKQKKISDALQNLRSKYSLEIVRNGSEI
jgi:DNA polymerase-4